MHASPGARAADRIDFKDHRPLLRIDGRAGSLASPLPTFLQDRPLRSSSFVPAPTAVGAWAASGP